MSHDKIKSEGATFTWIIQNHSMCNLKNGCRLDSPKFTEDKYGGILFNFNMYPKGWSSLELQNKSFFNVYGLDIEQDKLPTIDLQIEVLSPEYEIFQKFNLQERRSDCILCGDVNIIEINDQLEKSNMDNLIIRSYISFLSKTIKAITHFGCSQFSFKWLVEEPNSTDWSKSSKIPMFDGIPVQVLLTAPGNDILINIKKSSNVIPQVVKCKISLLDENAIEQDSKTDVYFFDSSCDTDTWTFPTFFTKDLLKSKQTNFVKNGTFPLMFNFTVSNGYDYEKIENEVQYKKFQLTNDIKISNVLFTLQDELHNEFMSKRFADVDIKLDEEVLCAHKPVLAAQSALFKELINDNKEKVNRIEICITDVDLDTFKLLLNFIYTGELDGNMQYDIFGKLLVAATKYKIPSLIEVCCYYLTSKMCDQNICEILDTADIIENTFLKNSAYSYIVKNSKTILTSGEWAELVLRNPKLAVDIFPLLAN